MYEITVIKEIGTVVTTSKHGARTPEAVERRKAQIRASVPAGSAVTIRVKKRF